MQPIDPKYEKLANAFVAEHGAAKVYLFVRALQAAYRVNVDQTKRKPASGWTGRAYR